MRSDWCLTTRLETMVSSTLYRNSSQQPHLKTSSLKNWLQSAWKLSIQPRLMRFASCKTTGLKWDRDKDSSLQKWSHCTSVSLTYPKRKSATLRTAAGSRHSSTILTPQRSCINFQLRNHDAIWACLSTLMAARCAKIHSHLSRKVPYNWMLWTIIFGTCQNLNQVWSCQMSSSRTSGEACKEMKAPV